MLRYLGKIPRPFLGPCPQRTGTGHSTPQQSLPPSSPSCFCSLLDYTLSQGRLIVWVSLSLSSAVLGKPLPSACSFRDQLFFGRERGSMTMKSFHLFFLQLLSEQSKPGYAPPLRRGSREPWSQRGELPPQAPQPKGGSWRCAFPSETDTLSPHLCGFQAAQFPCPCEHRGVSPYTDQPIEASEEELMAPKTAWFLV